MTINMDTSLEETTFFPTPVPFYGERKDEESSLSIMTEPVTPSTSQTVTRDEAVRILPVSIYSTEFVDPDKFPAVFGKPLEQRVWVIVAKLVNNVTRNALKNLRKRMETILDYTKYYDPYCKIRKTSVKIYLDPEYMHIVLDTMMSRKMRSDILNCISEIKEIRPSMVILSKLDQMLVYKVPDDVQKPGAIVQTIVMGRYIDRQKYCVPTKMYQEFPTIKLLPAINITASGNYVHKRINLSE